MNLELHPTPTKLQLTWERSLINTDYTILYCVDIFKVVEGEETFVHAKCVVDQTSYVFSTGESEPDPNDLFQFTITPRYNVDGARNGTSMNVTGYFIAGKVVYYKTIDDNYIVTLYFIEPLTLSQDSVSVDTVISRDLLVTLTITFHNAVS